MENFYFVRMMNGKHLQIMENLGKRNNQFGFFGCLFFLNFPNWLFYYYLLLLKIVSFKNDHEICKISPTTTVCHRHRNIRTTNIILDLNLIYKLQISCIYVYFPFFYFLLFVWNFFSLKYIYAAWQNQTFVTIL